MREPVVSARLQRLPVLSLLELSVARQHHDATTAAEVPLRPRDPATFRDSHSERPRVRLDSWRAHIRVPVEAPEPPQREKLLAGDHPERMQDGVEPGHVVPLRREEDVAIGVLPAELCRVQPLEQEVHDEVERAEGRAEVSRARPLHRDERVQAAHVGEEL